MSNWWVPTGGSHSKMTREQFRRFCIDVLEFGEGFDPVGDPLHAMSLARALHERLSPDRSIVVEIEAFSAMPSPRKLLAEACPKIGRYAVTISRRGHDVAIKAESKSLCEAVCRAVATRYGFRLKWGKA